MAASRFRPPKQWAPAIRRQPRAGQGRRHFAPKDIGFESEPAPVLRDSKPGIRNVPRKQQAAIRRDRKRYNERISGWKPKKARK